jgi:biopolymer transport protein TolQ
VNVHADLSFLTLILNASVIVQAIIALLALLSMWSWWQIFLKMFQLRRILRETDAFEAGSSTSSPPGFANTRSTASREVRRS